MTFGYGIDYIPDVVWLDRFLGNFRHVFVSCRANLKQWKSSKTGFLRIFNIFKYILCRMDMALILFRMPDV